MKGIKHLSLVLMMTSSILLMSFSPDPAIADDGAETGGEGGDAKSENGYVPGAINCYRCDSSSNPHCNAKAPGVPASHKENCPNPQKLISGWLKEIPLDKISFGSFNLETFITNVLTEVDVNAELQDVSGCVFFYATSESSVTKSIDGGISYMRKLWGDKDANASVTAKEFVLRDCATIRTREEVKSKADRCITIPRTKAVLTIYLCTCTSDKCNEGFGGSYLSGLIADAIGADAESGTIGNRYDNKFLIPTTMLSAYLIHRF